MFGDETMRCDAAHALLDELPWWFSLCQGGFPRGKPYIELSPKGQATKPCTVGIFRFSLSLFLDDEYKLVVPSDVVLK